MRPTLLFYHTNTRPSASTQAKANGVKTFHDMYINWSTRRRGSVQRSQIFRQTKSIPFEINQNELHQGPVMRDLNGLAHPPKKSTVATADTAKRFAYYAR